MSRRTELGELQSKLRRILLDNWDPLGVRVIGVIEDEYDTQVHAILSMMQHGPLSFDALRRYLDDEAYGYSRSWDDNEALDRTTRLIVGLQAGDGGGI